MELLASVRDIGCGEDGGNDADAAGSGREDIIHIIQRDTADGEPWLVDVSGSPTNVIKRDSGSTGLGGRGKDRADAKIGSPRNRGPFGLFGNVGA